MSDGDPAIAAPIPDSETIIHLTMNVEPQDEKVSELWAAVAALQQQLQTQHQSHSMELAALRAELTALEARSADGAAPRPVAPDASVCQLPRSADPAKRDCRFRSDPADSG